jgi:hypothetical protein
MVLGIPYQIKLVDEIDKVASDEERTWGETDNTLRLIKIDSTQDTRRRWTTLMHEYYHATLYVTGVSSVISDELEEIIVQTMEHSNEQFLRTYGGVIIKTLGDE